MGGVWLPTGHRLPPLRSNMDDNTCLVRTAPCTARLLRRLDQLITWARMKFKPSNVRSLSLQRGERNGRATFSIGWENIPHIIGDIRSLRRLYTSSFWDKEMEKTSLQQLSVGLSRFNSSQLPRKYKVWCYHFTLYKRLMRPLKLCEVTSSAVSRMYAKVNFFIRRWLGLPRCFSSPSLYKRDTLQLPLKSITLRYRKEKPSGDGVEGLFWREAEGHRCPGGDWEEVERGTGKQSCEQTPTPKSGGQGPNRAVRLGMGQSTQPIVKSQQEGEERPCHHWGDKDGTGGVKAVAQGQQGDLGR